MLSSEEDLTVHLVGQRVRNPGYSEATSAWILLYCAFRFDENLSNFDSSNTTFHALLSGLIDLITSWLAKFKE